MSGKLALRYAGRQVGKTSTAVLISACPEASMLSDMVFGETSALQVSVPHFIIFLLFFPVKPFSVFPALLNSCPEKSVFGTLTDIRWFEGFTELNCSICIELVCI